ncbi:hypothetical protein AMJ44_04440 [candidate division WOR-1 bacterium DG_54_3]|uniref:Uncharacterized protein n=1 Tax=candidate division WOR-1 bacterium DG_54_3 TaxID=1703775 RepID=A0A0S7Y4K3_UNCSA|nr:MAG: hypothetical protein AMJ44_04440 [candidate division WOR-1 bacterium DG_54_3]
MVTIGGDSNAAGAHLEVQREVFSALDELNENLDQMTLQLARCAKTGEDVDTEHFGSVDAATASGLFAVTQEVGINERTQMAVTAPSKKTDELAKAAVQEFKRSMG